MESERNKYLNDEENMRQKIIGERKEEMDKKDGLIEKLKKENEELKEMLKKENEELIEKLRKKGWIYRKDKERGNWETQERSTKSKECGGRKYETKKRTWRRKERFPEKNRR